MDEDCADDHRLLLLHPEDNVFVARAALKQGENVLIGGKTCAVRCDTQIGFKIARMRLNSGDKVLKYGAVIGSATTRIETGDRVHTDNMKSDYLPTYAHDGSGSFTQSEVE